MTSKSQLISIDSLFFVTALSFLVAACITEEIITPQEKDTSLVVSLSTEGFLLRTAILALLTSSIPPPLPTAIK